jgi:hypothetical protein
MHDSKSAEKIAKEEYKEELAFLEELEHEIGEHCEAGVKSMPHVENTRELLKAHKELCHYLMYKCAIHEMSEYSEVYHEIEDVIENPPHTWYPYMDKPGGHMNIIEMEVGEMMHAYEGMRATPPTMTHAQFVHELKHAAAAICYALEEMTCSDKEYHKKHHFHKPYPEEYGSKAK